MNATNEAYLPFYLFDDNRLSNYQCPICCENYNFQLKPYSLSCGHSICLTCYQLLSQSNQQKCPECRAQFNRMNPSVNQSLYRLLLQEKVFCIKQEFGCEFSGKFEEIGDHIEKYCEYTSPQEKKQLAKNFRYCPCKPKKPQIPDMNLIKEYYGEVNKEKLPEGVGELRFANGSYYKGDFKNGEYWGEGIYIQVYTKKVNNQHQQDNLNDAVYKGQWQNGRRYGKGRQEYPNKDWYEGDWKQNLREGEGIYTFSQGGFYKGGWRLGKYEGKGIMMHQDGSVYTGFWKNGLQNGKGDKQYNTGAFQGFEYSGDWENGQWHGQGTLTNYKGQYQKGYFENGKLIEGEHTEIDQKGKIIKKHVQCGEDVKGQNCTIF